jgi:hypothetical protein
MGFANCTSKQYRMMIPFVLESQRGKQMSLVIEEEAIERLPINIDPEIMSGTPVFEGTRVPVDALMNNRGRRFP